MNKHVLISITASLIAARAFAGDSITVINPSFQANLPGGVGYGTPDGWTPVGGVGVNNGGMPFADNGLIPDNNQVGFLQGVASLTQNLSGFSVGDLYWVQGFANARGGGDIPRAALSLAGTTILPPTTLPPVGGANPYYFVNIPWVATSASGDLAISSAPFAGGDATLLIDGISVIRRTALDVVIANPSFEASGNSFGFPGYISAPGFTAGWTRSGAGQIVINGSNGSGNPFADNGAVPDGGNVVGLQQTMTISQVLAGLTAGQTYRLSLDYNSRGGDDPTALIQIDGLTAFTGSVPEVGGVNPYYHLDYDFVASGTTTTVSLANLGLAADSTLLVDNVRVLAVPEPCGAALLALGSLTLLRRRRGV